MRALTVRKAHKGDIEALAALGTALNAYHDDATQLSAEALEADWDWIEAFVVETDEPRIIGFASGFNTYQFHTTKRGYEIQNLHVDEDYRRQGAAKALLEHILEVKRAQGVRKFTLGVLKQNEKARAFYKAFGFTEHEITDFLRCKIEE